LADGTEYKSAESEPEDGLQRSKRKTKSHTYLSYVLALSAENYINDVLWSLIIELN